MQTHTIRAHCPNVWVCHDRYQMSSQMTKSFTIFCYRDYLHIIPTKPSLQLRRISRTDPLHSLLGCSLVVWPVTALHPFQIPRTLTTRTNHPPAEKHVGENTHHVRLCGSPCTSDKPNPTDAKAQTASDNNVQSGSFLDTNRCVNKHPCYNLVVDRPLQ